MRSLLLLTLCTLTAIGSLRGVDLPGQRPDGSVLLPNQWILRPVGRQVPLGDFPVNLALHPGGKYGAVLHCGYSAHEIVVVDLASGAVASRTKVDEAFYGLAFSKDGAQLFCSGASSETVHVFHFANGQLDKPTAYPLRDAAQRGIPCGIAVRSDGLLLYAANLWGQSVSRVNLAGGTNLGPDLSLLPGGAKAPDAPVAPPSTDDPSITKRANQLLETTDPNSPFPYACLLDEKRSRLYISLWGQASIAVIDTKSFTVSARWATEDHPNEMVLSKDGKRLFVANANRNTVSVLDTADGHLVETLLAELTPNAPPGNTPNSLALSPDGGRLFVANANINTISVFDVKTSGKSRSIGFIPVGWYPTSVRISSDGATLYVVNGKGESSYPNPQGPNHAKGGKTTVGQYIGELLKGTLSIIPLPPESKFEAQMHDWTAQAYQCLPAGAQPSPTTIAAGNPIPVKPGGPSPIKYVFYIIKENRTYDQVLGDLKPGNGDPSLALFGEPVTPNHHAIAREFVTLDNFYVDAEVSASGHEWSMGAIANDFVEKTWHLSYGHGKSGKWPYPAEGGFPIATPAGGYLWDRAEEAGVSYRSYGEWVANGKGLGAPGTTKAKALEGHFDPWYRSFDTGYPDQKRADRFIEELHRFEKEGDMPRLQIVRLPNDHTSGTSPGKHTPAAQVADNDLAFGRVIEGLSHSKFWPQMAIFVIEDDAQNGSDHVDAHRTIAFAVSPYIRRGTVDSTMYSTSSMLHTIELILGLRPMTQFDAAAMPMWASFQATPDLALHGQTRHDEPGGNEHEDRVGRQGEPAHELHQGGRRRRSQAERDHLEIGARARFSHACPTPGGIRLHQQEESGQGRRLAGAKDQGRVDFVFEAGAKRNTLPPMQATDAFPRSGTGVPKPRLGRRVPLAQVCWPDLACCFSWRSLAVALDITTTDGRTYKDCTISKVEPDALRIIHSDGAARLPYEKLPPALQKQFFDPAKVAAYHEQVEEAKRAAAVKAEEERRQQQIAAAEAQEQREAEAEARQRQEDEKMAAEQAAEGQRLAVEHQKKTIGRRPHHGGDPPQHFSVFSPRHHWPAQDECHGDFRLQFLSRVDISGLGPGLGLGLHAGFGDGPAGSPASEYAATAAASASQALPGTRAPAGSRALPWPRISAGPRGPLSRIAEVMGGASTPLALPWPMCP